MTAVMSVPFLFLNWTSHEEAADPTTSDSTGLGVSPSPHRTGTHFKAPNGLLHCLISPNEREVEREIYMVMKLGRRGGMRQAGVRRPPCSLPFSEDQFGNSDLLLSKPKEKLYKLIKTN